MKLTEEQALHRMAAYCSGTERCLWDVKKKLANTELTDEQTDRILQRLTNEKFVDEQRFALAFVRDKVRFSGWGRVKISYELRKRHIAEWLIQKALNEVDSSEIDSKLLDILRKKNASLKADTNYQRSGKLLRFVASRGFGMDESLRAINQLLNLSDHEEHD